MPPEVHPVRRRRLLTTCRIVVIVAAGFGAGRYPNFAHLETVVTVLATAASPMTGLLAAIASVSGALVRSHGIWRPSVGVIVGAALGLGVGALWANRRGGRRSTWATVGQILGTVVASLAAGTVAHLVMFAHETNAGGHSAVFSARYAFGAFLALTIMTRSRAHDVDNSVFLAMLVAAGTVASVLLTVGVWARQDEGLLDATALSTSVLFSSELGQSIAAVTQRLSGVDRDTFTIDRFARLVQPLVYGRPEVVGAQLFNWSVADGPQLLATSSSLGSDFDAMLATWLVDRSDAVRHLIDTGIAADLGSAALPDQRNHVDNYLIYGFPMPAAKDPNTAPTMMIAALSVDEMMQVAIAPTVASEHLVTTSLYTSSDAGTAQLLWSSTPTPTTTAAALVVPTPHDLIGELGVNSILVDSTDFVFTITPQHDFGAPISERRTIIAVELLLGVATLVGCLVAGDRRSKRERERERREALLAAALEAAPGWTAIVDTHDRVIMANHDDHGVSAGSALDEVQLWQHDAAGSAAVGEIVRGARGGTSGSTQIVWCDPLALSAPVRIFDVTARPLPEPMLVFVQCVDVTEHRDRAMRTAQSERMEAIGVLAGGLAHDFNNLLFITLGYLQMLERLPTVADHVQTATYVDRAIEAVERGATVAKSLLSFARSQPLSAVPINLRQFVDDLRPLIDQALGSANRLEIEVVGAGLDVVADPGRLSSSILNTVFNARDAMETPGAVFLRVERCVAAPVGGVAASMVAISVSDTGRGMTPEVIARAFEPFFTTKKFGSGTGLGLSTVYSFAQQSGGWATIDSTEGVGTTITMFLPLALEPDAHDEPKRPGRSATRALVVDDESALADLVAGWLDDLGMTTRVATSPQQALAIAESFWPELLVSDANLNAPIDGLELARTLVERDPALLVVFMTGFSERIRALQTAGVATLAKPFSRDDLVVSLRTHLGDWVDRGGEGMPT